MSDQVRELLERVTDEPSRPFDVQVAYGRAGRRRRRSWYWAGSVAFVAVLAASAAGLVFGRSGSEYEVGVATSDGDETVTYESEEFGFSVRVPSAWQVAESSLTPDLAGPLEILAVGTFSMSPGQGCGPATAVAQMDRSDALVWVSELSPELFPRASLENYPRRPDHFDGSAGRLADRGFECFGSGPDGTSHRQILFSDVDRFISAYVVVGPDASPDRQAEVWRILNSLAFEPSTGEHLLSPREDVPEPAGPDFPEPYGPPPADEEASRSAVEQAFTTALGGESEHDARVDALENGEVLLEVEDELTAGVGGDVASRVRVSVGEVRFLSPSEAAVEYTLRLEEQPLLGPRVGRAVRLDGTWKVSATTFCELVSC